jgi:4-aminobutyrate aminotransferase-like enzyme
MDDAKLLARRQQLVGKATLFYTDPVHLVRGNGVYLYDSEGRQYIDMYNNVPCVGHANPLVVDRVTQQLSTLNVHSRYLHGGILDFAERLTNLHHSDLEQAVFACSGTEASEIALMMSRLATGGQGIICSDATYHGNSTEVAKMSANPVSDPHFRSIPFPQLYRPLQEGIGSEELVQLYLNQLQVAIDDFAAHQIPFAGLFVCSLFANEGLPDIPAGFMSRAVDLVHRAGGLVIADEVQAGYCRSGNWWGYETNGFIPDIVTMGKPMGNGMPLSAVVSSEELVTIFRNGTGYFNTFASSPAQAAAGMAVLDVIEQEELLSASAAVGDYLRAELAGLQGRAEAMGDVRGCGLFISIEWVSDRDKKTPDQAGAINVADRMKSKGFLLSNAGALENVVKIRPPLVFNKSNADAFLGAFAEMLDDIC